MIEPYKNNQRIFFSPGQQREYINKIKNLAGESLPKLAQKLRVNRRVLNDWINEKYSLPKSFTDKVSSIFGIDLPNNVQIRSKYWFTKEAGIKGGKAVFKKYGRIGDPKICRKRWLKWWNKTGKYNLNQYFIAKQIHKPARGEKLAEFVGIMIGDGGITSGQVTVTLNRVTDVDYSRFVKNLFQQLFDTAPSLNKSANSLAVDITVSRKKLVSFCQTIGLKVGNKLAQGLDIPEWVQKNKKFCIYCLRGLIDTDGCIFNECHKIKGKVYNYPRLAFTSYSSKLRLSVFRILENLGFSPKIRTGREYFSFIQSFSTRLFTLSFCASLGKDSPAKFFILLIYSLCCPGEKKIRWLFLYGSIIIPVYTSL